MRLKDLHCICDKSASNGTWPLGNLLTSTRLTSADCVTVVPTPSCPNALEPHDKTRPQSTRGTEEGKKALKHAEIFRLWCPFLEHCCTEFWKNTLQQSPHHQHSRTERHQQKTYICGQSLSYKMYASVLEIWFGLMSILSVAFVVLLFLTSEEETEVPTTGHLNNSLADAWAELKS